MDTSPDAVAARIAHLRELSGLDAANFGHRAGLSRSHIGQILRRRVAMPDVGTLQQIADATGVALTWLLAGIGDEPTAATVRAAIHATPPHAASDFAKASGA